MSICIKIFLALSLGFLTSCSNKDEEFTSGNDHKAGAQAVDVDVDVEGPGKPTNPTTPVAPVVVPPAPVPVPLPPIPIPIDSGDHRRGNDDHDHDCPDQDSDGVCDPRDKCPGFDDRIDLDGDGTPGNLEGGCDCEPENAAVGAGDFCSDTTTCAVSVCDPQGSGECIVTDAPFGTECGDIQAGDCDADDACDGQGNCVNLLQPDGSACGNTAFAICDVDDTCLNGDCVDNRALEGTVCRASAGICDVEEVCDGTFIVCPDDVKVAVGTQCRAAAGECDVAETCNGGSALCPPDAFIDNGAICGDAPIGLCDRENQCQGGVCEELFYGEDYLCRGAVDQECDVPEYCTGVDFDCPVDIIVDPGTECGEPGSDQQFCSTEPACTPAGRCVGIPVADGPTLNECNANNGEPRCDGFITCQDGIDVCVPEDGTAIECTEQIILDPNQPPVLDNTALALGDPTLFAWSVAIYGNWAAVGNGGCSDRSTFTSPCDGFVYIYKYNTNTDEWDFHQTIQSEEGEQGFGAGTGFSVDMYEDLLIFGQRPVFVTPGVQGGFTIARLNADTWSREFTVLNDDSSFNFGNAVSIYSDGGTKQYAMAGSPSSDNVVIYIYNYNGTGTWDQVAFTQGSSGINLGTSVRIRGETAIAAAPLLQVSGNTVGRIKVYHRTGNGPFTYSYDQDGTGNQGLGDFRGNNALGLDPVTNRFFAADRSTQITIFQDNGTSATLLQTITTAGPGDSGTSAATVALNGTTLIIGNPTAGPGFFTGQADIYVETLTNFWTLQESITPSAAEVNTQHFGYSVSAQGGRLIVGGPSMDVFIPQGNSRAYLYGLIP